jgi:hypothetical protein
VPRFCLGTPGAWQWETECSDTTNTGLHRQRGTVHVSPYRGDSLLYRYGFLKVSDNRRHLTYRYGPLQPDAGRAFCAGSSL